MADKVIKFLLSQESVKAAANELRRYKSGLDEKCKLLCEKLCEAGIGIAKSYVGSGKYAEYVVFESEISPEEAGCKAMFYMGDSQKIENQWKLKDDTIKSAIVSPSLMIEFGSGTKAENPAGIEGMGQGTFPGQTHAFEKGWSWQDLDGKWHYSQGHEACLPMYHAGQEVRDKVAEIAKEVFR